jgi:hypothetical protein
MLWKRYLAALEGRAGEDEVLGTAQLSALHARESRTIRQLSADLRLTPMARVSNKQVEGNQTLRQRLSVPKPWEG